MIWMVRIVVLIFLAGCSAKKTPWQSVPLPAFSEPVVLRVVYAENPRFAKLPESDLRTLLRHAENASLEHLGIRVSFELLPPIGIDALFRYLFADVRKARANEIYDFRRAKGDRKRLIEAMQTGIGARHTPLNAMIAYAAPHLSRPLKAATMQDLAESLTDTLLERIAIWQTLKASDGAPVLDASPYNEWIYWDSLGYAALPFDIVITNTLIASVEYHGQDIHSALRGGLTVGTTTNNRSKLGAYIFWSTFPFIEEYPLLKQLRDIDYDPDDALLLSGTYLAHEIGHLLFHFGHPFETDACIMTPVPMLHFKAWYEKLDKKQCDAGTFPAMQKGAAKLYYRPDW
jgi:hypothetical protein